jgi:hypothetical protein
MKINFEIIPEIILTIMPQQLSPRNKASEKDRDSPLFMQYRTTYVVKMQGNRENESVIEYT